MDALVSGNRQKTQSHDESNAFLFKSEYKTIRSGGVIEKITKPAQGIEKQDSLLKQHIQNAFDKARSLGQENPIVVGAIPFDVSQPTNLIVPEWWVASSIPRFSSQEFVDPDVASQVSSYRSIPGFDVFTDGVKTAIKAFRSGRLEKAVLSRILEIEMESEPDHDQIMANIMAQNPQAFHFRVPIEGGVLLGASPELLIRKEGQNVFSNPLAGSAKRSANKVEDEAASYALSMSEKDHFEHKLVIDVMREQLVPVCSSLDIPDTPSLIHTPTMWHLSSKIQGVLKDATTSAMEMACLIHPTPAMCGSPTHVARDLIAELEPHQRGFFSGMVGWCDSQGNGEWAVTIRCATIHQKTVRIFAGAGVVESSVPESEWAETRAKFNTMLNAFGVNQKIV